MSKYLLFSSIPLKECFGSPKYKTFGRWDWYKSGIMMTILKASV